MRRTARAAEYSRRKPSTHVFAPAVAARAWGGTHATHPLIEAAALLGARSIYMLTGGRGG